MTVEGAPVRVRIVGEPGRQLVAASFTLALLVAVAVYARRRHYGPLVATRTARRLRRLAQRIEDAGLNIARRDTTS